MRILIAFALLLCAVNGFRLNEVSKVNILKT